MAASTNDAAWGYVGQGGCDGLCVVAEQQTAGRGRRGRVWHSQSGQSVLFSLLLSAHAGSLSLLSLAAPVAMAESIERVCGLDAAVKWPNDVLIHGKKVAGILIESRKTGGQAFFVVGIGVNVHQDKAFFNAQPMDAPATSGDIESGRHVDRNIFVRTLLERMEYWVGVAGGGVGIAHPTGNKSEILSTKSETNSKFKSCNDPNDVCEADSVGNPMRVIKEWTRRNRQIGERIQLESDGTLYSGTCIGIDPAEGLIVQLDGGGVRMFSAATATVVKSKIDVG